MVIYLRHCNLHLYPFNLDFFLIYLPLLYFTCSSYLPKPVEYDNTCFIVYAYS